METNLSEDKIFSARAGESRTRAGPLLNRKLTLFMGAMVLANIGGNMYGPLLPL